MMITVHLSMSDRWSPDDEEEEEDKGEVVHFGFTPSSSPVPPPLFVEVTSPQTAQVKKKSKR